MGSATWTAGNCRFGLRTRLLPGEACPCFSAQLHLRARAAGARWLYHAPARGYPLLAGLVADPRPATAAPAEPLRRSGLCAPGLGGHPRHEGGALRRAWGCRVPELGAPDAGIPLLQVRGAPAIALVGCLSLAVELQAGAGGPGLAELVAFVRDALSFLVTARPTAVNMARAARDLAEAAAREAEREGATEETVRER